MTMIHSLATPALLKSHLKPDLASPSSKILKKREQIEKKNFYLPQDLWNKIFSYAIGSYLNHCKDHKYNLFRVFKSPSFELTFLKENPRAIHEIIHFTRGNFATLKPLAQTLLHQVKNHITKLDLSNIPLTADTLHQILTWFPNIQSLTLSGKGVSTLITEKFLCYKNLEELIIVGVRSQPFSVKLMNRLSTLQQLRKLELIEYKEIAPGAWPYLQTMTQLTSIKIASYAVTDKNMEVLSALEKLTVLHLGDCSHLSSKGFYYLSTLNQLTELSLDALKDPIVPIHNQISFILALKNLRIFKASATILGLNELQILRNHSFEHLSVYCKVLTQLYIQALSQLIISQELHLHYLGPRLSSYRSGPQYLVDLPTLRKLDIHFSYSPSVGEWENLSYFQSHRKDVDLAISIDIHPVPTSNDWKYLASMQGLSELTISHVIINDELEPFVHLPRLKKIVFKNSTIANKAWKNLGALQKITDLEFVNCHITDDTIRFLASLTSLETLKLPTAQLNGNTFPILASLKNLKKLDLTNCSINDRTVDGILELQKQLPSLHISQYATFQKQSPWEYFVSQLTALLENFLTFMAFLLLGILIEITIIAIVVCLLELLTFA